MKILLAESTLRGISMEKRGKYSRLKLLKANWKAAHMARAKQIGLKLSGKQPANPTRAGAARKSIPNGLGKGGKHKFRPGTLALKEIRKYQKSTDLLIRRAPFQRLVRQLAPFADELRFQASALVVFQEAAENFLTNLLEDAYRCALHAKRVTLMPRDIVLIYKIKYARFLTTSMI